MKKKIKQYRNLIILIAAIAAITLLFVSDPLGYAAKRQLERAEVRSQIAIEKARTEKEISILEAEQKAAVKRIELGIYLDQELQELEGNPDGISGDELPEEVK